MCKMSEERAQNYHKDGSNFLMHAPETFLNVNKEGMDDFEKGEWKQVLANAANIFLHGMMRTKVVWRFQTLRNHVIPESN